MSLASSAPRGLASREGLELGLTKIGRTGPLAEPRCRPQAGKSGDPRSQDADRWRGCRCVRSLLVALDAKLVVHQRGGSL